MWTRVETTYAIQHCPICGGPEWLCPMDHRMHQLYEELEITVRAEVMHERATRDEPADGEIRCAVLECGDWRQQLMSADIHIDIFEEIRQAIWDAWRDTDKED